MYAFTDGALSITFPSVAQGEHSTPDALILATGAYVADDGNVTTEVDFSPLVPMLYEIFGEKVLTITLREMAAMFIKQAEEIENKTGDGGEFLASLSEFGFQPDPE